MELTRSTRIESASPRLCVCIELRFDERVGVVRMRAEMKPERVHRKSEDKRRSNSNRKRTYTCLISRPQRSNESCHVMTNRTPTTGEASQQIIGNSIGGIEDAVAVELPTLKHSSA